MLLLDTYVTHRMYSVLLLGSSCVRFSEGSEVIGAGLFLLPP